MDVIDTIFLKKHRFFSLFIMIGCFCFVFSSLHSFGAERKETFPFYIILNPMSHRLEKVSVEDIFSIMDLRLLAEEASFSASELALNPESEESDPFPWDNKTNASVIESKGIYEGVSLPNPQKATWFDRLMQNAKKYKS